MEISIQFTRFSAFYSPLIATMAGGFLEQEGLRPRHSVSAPGKSAIAGLLDGSVHVAQSAPSQGELRQLFERSYGRALSMRHILPNLLSIRELSICLI